MHCFEFFNRKIKDNFHHFWLLENSSGTHLLLRNALPATRLERKYLAATIAKNVPLQSGTKKSTYLKPGKK
jgi:hypothetical protein